MPVTDKFLNEKLAYHAVLIAKWTQSDTNKNQLSILKEK